MARSLDAITNNTKFRRKETLRSAEKEIQIRLATANSALVNLSTYGKAEAFHYVPRYTYTNL